MQVADQVARSRAGRARVFVLAAVVLLLALGGWWATHLLRPAAPPTPTPSPVDTKAGAAAVAKIKVGIMLSDYTGTDPSPMGRPFSWRIQTEFVDLLTDSDLDLYPLIEPGTQDKGELPKLLAGFMPGKKPLNAADLADLRKVDVIVCGMMSSVREDVLQAMERAVEGGVGLFNHRYLGFISPGSSPVIDHLAGLQDGYFSWHGREMPCDVVGEHPLLGSLSGQKGKVLMLKANGGTGQVIGQPLVRWREDSSSGSRDRHGRALCPLYVSQFGHGRIVCLNVDFLQESSGMNELQAANDGRFYVRCMQWLANRPIH